MTSDDDFEFKKKKNFKEAQKAHFRPPENERPLTGGGKVTAQFINGVNINDLFIECVKAGDAVAAKKLMIEGFNINAQDEHGMTALHYAAAMGARPCVRLLVNSGKCDYLIQDNQGRYASELAFEWAHDYAVGVLLSKKQVKQACAVI